MARFRVKELARERGMTQEDISKASGLKLNVVRSLWQNRTRDPHFSTVVAVARTLGVPIEALFAPDGELMHTDQQDNKRALIAA